MTLWQLYSFYLTPEPGDPPAHLAATVISATSIYLTWSEPFHPNGVLVSYNITYNLTGTYTSIIVNAVDTTSYTFTNLSAFTYYKFLISASTRVGAGPVATIATRTDESSKWVLVGTLCRFKCLILYFRCVSLFECVLQSSALAVYHLSLCSTQLFSKKCFCCHWYYECYHQLVSSRTQWPKWQYYVLCPSIDWCRIQ